MELSVIVISGIAVGIAAYSHIVMRAVANLDYDEKLATIASHSERIKTKKSLNTIETIKYDFSAVSNLRWYASREKKEKLIRDFIIPILEEIIDSENVSGESAIAVGDIIKTAQKYKIDTDKINELRQKLRATESNESYNIKP